MSAQLSHTEAGTSPSVMSRLKIQHPRQNPANASNEAATNIRLTKIAAVPVARGEA